MKHFDEKVTRYIINRDRKLTSTLYKKQEMLEGVSTYMKSALFLVPRNGLGEGLKAVTKKRVVSDIYGKRILLKVTNECFAHCRYCFRKDEINNPYFKITQEEIDEGISYVRKNNVIDVVLSGGDPLLLSNNKFLQILDDLYSINSMKRITIDTNVMATDPKRITNSLIEGIKTIRDKFKKQLIFSIHFTRKSELTIECKEALYKLQNIGVVLRSHTPLLKGVNNSSEILHDLFEELVNFGVHPYYLIHFIATKHNKHFEIPLSEGLDIYKEILKKSAGVEIPSYVFYTPTGKGKVRLLPTSVTNKGNGLYEFVDRDGDLYSHKDYSYTLD